MFILNPLTFHIRFRLFSRVCFCLKTWRSYGAVWRLRRAAKAQASATVSINWLILLLTIISLTFFILLEDDLPPHIYYPIAICPYKLFPGESKPISKLLAQELPLQLDVSHELESEENDPADGSKVKKTVTIPYSEFA